jgi:hypothetical protein
MLCRKCLEALEPSFTRKRNMRYTAEDGPTTQKITVAVGRCLEDGRYSTIYPDEIVRNKQYCISEIGSVLEGKADFSMACQRTRANWEHWFRIIWDEVVRNIQRYIGRALSENDISIALHAFLKGCGDDWLRYVLDIFYTEFNNLCMFFDTSSDSIDPRSEKLHKPHVYGGAVAPKKGRKPP